MKALLWYGLPAFSLALVLAYVAAAIVLHVNPPVVPVQGVSMRPMLQAGDLVFLEGIEPRSIRKGEVIAVNVPKQAREKYSLPGRVVHRVIKIEHTSAGLVFQTKGDSNPGPDVFKVPAGEVVGRMTGHVAGLGYPLLFFRSIQGKILLGAVALVILLYFLIGLFEERQATVQGTALGMQAVLEETRELRTALDHHLPQLGGHPRTDAPGHPPERPPEPTQPPTRSEEPSVVLPTPAATAPATAPPAAPAPAVERSEENAEALHKLLVAVGEYGEHLRSHTAVMKGLAETTAELHRATEELRRTVAGQGPAAAQPEPEPPQPGPPQHQAPQPGAQRLVTAPTPSQARPPSEPARAQAQGRRALLLAAAAAAGAAYVGRRLGARR